MAAGNSKRTCFVVMGFGEKTDFQSNPQRVLDLNKTYRYIIEPAVVDSGLECIRADTIIHSTVIDKPMYEHLLAADLVIADLSTSNANAIYELGVRHALRPQTTIVMADDKFAFPFDFSHLSILKYEHLGKGIDHGEVERVKTELKKKIAKLVGNAEVDSPVFLFLPTLARATTTAEAASSQSAPPAAARGGESFDDLMQRFEAAKVEAERKARAALMEGFQTAKARAQNTSDWLAAISFLNELRKMQPNDPYIVQQLALATYKSETPDRITALRQARSVLEPLAPSTSIDAETVGLWGAIHKRLWDLGREPADLDRAIRAYARGYFIRSDHYNGINFAFLLDVRASVTSGDDAVADRVVARRIRREVLELCAAALAGAPADADAAFWVRASKVEALVGLGDPVAEQELAEAVRIAPQAWMAATMQQQIATLTTLLR